MSFGKEKDLKIKSEKKKQKIDAEVTQHLLRVKQSTDRVVAIDEKIQEGDVTPDTLKELSEAYEQWIIARRAKDK